MGQRFQTFIHTHNPINSFEIEGETEKEKSIKRLAISAKYNSEFGVSENTVLAFHNQWLYGVSAVANAFQLLHFIKNAGEYHNPFKKEFWKIQYSARTIEDAVKLLVDTTTNIQRIANSPLYKEVGRVGISNFWYLNPEEPTMRTNWDNGDNNDGCLIVDATTGKYCFIVAFKLKGLKKYVPYSAMQYAAAYYPNTQKLMEADFKENKKYYEENGRKINDEQFNAELNGNKEMVSMVETYLKEYEVLTIDEVKAIFPKVAYPKPRTKKVK